MLIFLYLYTIKQFITKTINIHNLYACFVCKTEIIKFLAVTLYSILTKR